MVPEVPAIMRPIEALDPSLFDVERIEITSFEQLGLGEGNLNYVFSVGDTRYLCRVNIEAEKSDKTEREYRMLERIADHGFSPRPIHFNREPEFSILEFIEGTPFPEGTRTFTSTQIDLIAQVLAELHSVETDIEPSNVMYGYYTNGAQKLIAEANERTRNASRHEFEHVFRRILTLIPEPETHELALIHGDVCPQNIVETENGIALIDWESTEVSDPARDIANVMIDLKLEGADLERFFDTYHRIRTDPPLRERALVYSALMLQNYFFWELIRTSEIIRRELPEAYLMKTSAEEHMRSARDQLDALEQFIEVPRIDVERLFPSR